MEPHSSAAAIAFRSEPPRQPVVLCLIGDVGVSSIAVDRASQTARSLGAALRVVVVLSQRTNDGDPAAVLERTVDRLVEVGVGELDIQICAGDLFGIAVEAGSAGDIDLVVVSPDVVDDGDVAVEIADELAVPVLVAREPHPNRPIVATTDMTQPAYPVLAASWSFARMLEQPITFFHNATPTELAALNPMLGPPSFLRERCRADDGAASKRARLVALAAGSPDVETVVTRSIAVVASILAAAEERDAAIVAVGHGERAWLRRVLGNHVAEKIVERCSRSVLIVPIERR